MRVALKDQFGMLKAKLEKLEEIASEHGWDCEIEDHGNGIIDIYGPFNKVAIKPRATVDSES